MATINGDDTDNVLNGTADADDITGGAGNDTINAGGGDDVVDGGSSTLTNTDLFLDWTCLLYTSPSPRDRQKSRMPSSA